MLDYLSHPFAPDFRPYPLQGGDLLVLEEASLTSVPHVLSGPSSDANRLRSQCKEGVTFPEPVYFQDPEKAAGHTRKVKYIASIAPLLVVPLSECLILRCDEAKPQCNQCARLGHECDYSHKVAFKDETSKVVDKYLGSNRPRIPPWNPAAEPDSDNEPRPSAAIDTLGAFATLTNDEERQRKAEYRRPGTYFIVATPSSFLGLEEYRNTSNEPPERSSTAFDDSTQTVTANIALDAETIILGTFEDHPQQPAAWSLPALSNLGGHDYDDASPQTPSFPRFPSNLDGLRASPSSLVETTQLSSTPSARQEERLLQHYRSFVRRHVVQIRRVNPDVSTGDSGFGPDLFEQEASNFAPLRYALMALSSLSLAHTEGSRNVLALQYYQKALSPLQNNLRIEQDMASNGAFLTHFVLLLYEIAAAEPLWATHISHLDQIAQVRRNVYGMEPFPAIVWWVFIIDTHALLCGIGKGTFISNLIRNGHVPTSADMIRAPGLVEPSSHVPEEAPMMPSTLDFHRVVTLLAARLGLIASNLRSAASLRISSAQPRVPQASHPQWQQQVHEIQESLRQAWRTQVPLALSTGYRDQTLPARICGIYEHRTETTPEYPEEVTQCASEIIDVVSETVRRRRFEHGFVIFPLFLAGIATTSAADKALAHELMTAMEQESVGNNKRATRKLLEAVYEAQNARQMVVGHSLDVDWIQVMSESKLHVINFGL
ncbi:hypothetical protein MMC26_001354 [Xylographa opegraphella]|nr:hypothetical protein [Xylographa opegraphella]